MRTPRRSLVIVMVLGVTSGCDAGRRALYAQQSADRLHGIAARPVVCQAGPDCEAKWARAVDFVTRSCRWKLRIATDTLVTTEGPLDTCDPALMLQKTPVSGGLYRLVLTVNGGCWDATASAFEQNFVEYMNGPGGCLGATVHCAPQRCCPVITPVCMPDGGCRSIGGVL